MPTIEFKSGRANAPLAANRLVVGRDPQSDIFVDDPSVSSQHAALHRVGNTYRIEDLQSTNGTRVNGTLVQEAVLKHGDRLTFGSAEGEFATHELAQPDRIPAHGNFGWGGRWSAVLAHVWRSPRMIFASAAILLLLVVTLALASRLRHTNEKWVILTENTATQLISSTGERPGQSTIAEKGDCYPILAENTSGGSVTLRFGEFQFTVPSSRVQMVGPSDLPDAQANYRKNFSNYFARRTSAVEQRTTMEGMGAVGEAVSEREGYQDGLEYIRTRGIPTTAEFGELLREKFQFRVAGANNLQGVSEEERRQIQRLTENSIESYKRGFARAIQEYRRQTTPAF